MSRDRTSVRAAKPGSARVRCLRPGRIANTPSTTYTTISTILVSSQPLPNIAHGRMVSSISAAVSRQVSMV